MPVFKLKWLCIAKCSWLSIGLRKSRLIYHSAKLLADNNYSKSQNFNFLPQKSFYYAGSVTNSVKFVI